MKKVLSAIGLVLTVSIVFYGITIAAETKEAPKKTTKKAQHMVTVAASGTALWDYLKKEDYAKNWKMWPGKTAFYPGTEPHGALLTTYVNAPAEKAIGEKWGKLAVGSIVVKENYTPDKKLAAVTVMYKIKNYNRQAGDWFWAKYAPDGKVDAEGKVDMCIKCHGAKKTNDYIMTAPLK